MLQFTHLSSIAGVTHGITQQGDSAPQPLMMGEQVHKDKAVWVDAVVDVPVRGADALLTKTANITLGVRVADCVPLLFADKRGSMVGVAHAGWRGTALEIARKAIDAARIPAHAFMVGVGPAICPECFEVGPEVAKQFSDDVVRESETDDDRFFVDLWQANVNQLLDAGVPRNNIEVMRRCTLEDQTLFSFRAGDRDDRNIGFISRR